MAKAKQETAYIVRPLVHLGKVKLEDTVEMFGYYCVQDTRERIKQGNLCFSFDDETRNLLEKMGYIPKGCYCSGHKAAIAKHKEKNREVVMEEWRRKQGGA